MNESDQPKESNSSISVPKWFWVIAVVALLWNLMGCAAFLMEVFAQEWSMEQQEWSEDQKEWARSMPSWIYWVYGIAVLSGAAGGVSLLIRKKWAIPLFAVCVVAVIFQMVYAMVIAGGIEVMGASAAVMPSLVVVFAIGFLCFSVFAKNKEWLTD